MDDQIRRALSHGHTIDITTTGRRIGSSRVASRSSSTTSAAACTSPACRAPTGRAPGCSTSRPTRISRSTSRARRRPTSPATARIITDEAERRAVFDRGRQRSGRTRISRPWSRYSPLIEVTLDDARCLTPRRAALDLAPRARPADLRRRRPTAAPAAPVAEVRAARPSPRRARAMTGRLSTSRRSSRARSRRRAGAAAADDRPRPAPGRARHPPGLDGRLPPRGAPGTLATAGRPRSCSSSWPAARSTAPRLDRTRARSRRRHPEPRPARPTGPSASAPTQLPASCCPRPADARRGRSPSGSTAPSEPQPGRPRRVPASTCRIEVASAGPARAIPRGRARSRPKRRLARGRPRPGRGRLVDQRRDEVVELGRRVVAQAGVDLGRLDDRARRGDQPVEPLGLARAGRSVRRSGRPRRSARWRRGAAGSTAGSRSGANAARRRSSRAIRAPRKRRGRHSRTTPTLRHSPRSTRGTTRTIAYWNALRGGSDTIRLRRRTGAAPRAGGAR